MLNSEFSFEYKKRRINQIRISLIVLASFIILFAIILLPITFTLFIDLFVNLIISIIVFSSVTILCIIAMNILFVFWIKNRIQLKKQEAKVLLKENKIVITILIGVSSLCFIFSVIRFGDLPNVIREAQYFVYLSGFIFLAIAILIKGNETYYLRTDANISSILASLFVIIRIIEYFYYFSIMNFIPVEIIFVSLINISLIWFYFLFKNNQQNLALTMIFVYGFGLILLNILTFTGFFLSGEKVQKSSSILSYVFIVILIISLIYLFSIRVYESIAGAKPQSE